MEHQPARSSVDELYIQLLERCGSARRGAAGPTADVDLVAHRALARGGRAERAALLCGELTVHGRAAIRDIAAADPDRLVIWLTRSDISGDEGLEHLGLLERRAQRRVAGTAQSTELLAALAARGDFIDDLIDNPHTPPDVIATLVGTDPGRCARYTEGRGGADVSRVIVAHPDPRTLVTAAARGGRSRLNDRAITSINDRYQLCDPATYQDRPDTIRLVEAIRDCNQRGAAPPHIPAITAAVRAASVDEHTSVADTLDTWMQQRGYRAVPAGTTDAALAAAISVSDGTQHAKLIATIRERLDGDDVTVSDALEAAWNHPANDPASPDDATVAIVAKLDARTHREALRRLAASTDTTRVALLLASRGGRTLTDLFEHLNVDRVELAAAIRDQIDVTGPRRLQCLAQLAADPGSSPAVTAEIPTAALERAGVAGIAALTELLGERPDVWAAFETFWDYGNRTVGDVVELCHLAVAAHS